MHLTYTTRKRGKDQNKSTVYDKIKKSGRLQCADNFGVKLSDRTIILPKSVAGVPVELIERVRTEIAEGKVRTKEGDS